MEVGEIRAREKKTRRTGYSCDRGRNRRNAFSRWTENSMDRLCETTDFFLGLIRTHLLYGTLQVAEPVACGSVQCDKVPAAMV